jgi:predicted protein tyrosine phosphatase
MLSHLPFIERIYHGLHLSFLVLGRHDIETIQLDVPYAVISATDPEREAAILAESPNRRAVLRLSFHDKSGPRAAALGKIALTVADAHAILDFVEANRHEVNLIVCQCEAGISRSAAIAAALSRIVQDEDQFFFEHYAPNDWIYQTLLEAAEESDYAPK